MVLSDAPSSLSVTRSLPHINTILITIQHNVANIFPLSIVSGPSWPRHVLHSDKLTSLPCNFWWTASETPDMIIRYKAEPASTIDYHWDIPTIVRASLPSRNIQLTKDDLHKKRWPLEYHTCWTYCPLWSNRAPKESHLSIPGLAEAFRPFNYFDQPATITKRQSAVIA